MTDLAQLMKRANRIKRATGNLRSDLEHVGIREMDREAQVAWLALFHITWMLEQKVREERERHAAMS